MGVLVPLLGYLSMFVLGDASWWAGQLTWAGVAFLGVALLVSPRTRQVGVGILLGFALLFVVGAGVCTAAFVTMA